MDGVIGAAFVTGTFLILNQWYTNHQKKLEAIKKPDLADTDYGDLIEPILEHIRDTVGAHRVFYLAAQNGEKTLDGYSIKKLSMMAESNADGVDNIIRDIQGLPTAVFRRCITSLKDSDQGFFVSHESELNDQLARINTAHGIQTQLCIQVFNIKHGKKWTGILCVSFEEKQRTVHPTEIGSVELQVGRIESLISKL